MTLFERVFAEAAGRPNIKDRNLAKFMRNVRKQAVTTTKKQSPAKGTVSTASPDMRKPPRDIPGEYVPGHGHQDADWIAQKKVARTLRPLRTPLSPEMSRDAQWSREQFR